MTVFVGAALSQAQFRRPLDRNFQLFEAEDKAAWMIFTIVFLGLILFDNLALFGKPRKLSFASAVMYTIGWAFTAFTFCLWVGWWQAPRSAYMWLSGYTLQWMMSFDNLFVFHLIFKVYHTPDNLKHRPLFIGILGQAVMTLSLLTCGEWLFHKLFFLHIVFGLFFIYIGVTSALGDDDDDDPTQNPIIQWLQAKLPFISAYDSQGHFFVQLPVDEKGTVFIPKAAVVSCGKSAPDLEDLYEARQWVKDDAEAVLPVKCDEKVNLAEKSETDALIPKKLDEEDANEAKATIIDMSRVDLQGQKTQMRATMLFLVVCTMEISDVIFSVDTIVAVSVQVGDLFLAFTCVAFALLTLRATFFIVEVLAQMFSLMKYGIGAILAYIGVKLIIDRWVLVPHLVDLLVLVGTFGGSIVASAIYDGMNEDDECGAEQLLTSRTESTTTPGENSDNDSRCRPLDAAA